MIWVSILVVLIFLALIGMSVSFLVLRSKSEVMEVRQDKTVWVTHDLNRTRSYISGYVENEKEVNGRIVLLLKPTYIGLNEKVADIEPFPICVTKSMIKRTNEAKNPVMFIEPHFTDEYMEVFKDSKWFDELFGHRTQMSMLEKTNVILKNQLIDFSTTVPKAIRIPYDNVLSEKGKVKKSVDIMNNPMPQQNGNIPIVKRY